MPLLPGVVYYNLQSSQLDKIIDDFSPLKLYIAPSGTKLAGHQGGSFQLYLPIESHE